MENKAADTNAEGAPDGMENVNVHGGDGELYASTGEAPSSVTESNTSPGVAGKMFRGCGPSVDCEEETFPSLTRVQLIQSAAGLKNKNSVLEKKKLCPDTAECPGCRWLA